LITVDIKTQAKDKVALLKEMKNTKKLIRKKKWYKKKQKQKKKQQEKQKKTKKTERENNKKHNLKREINFSKGKIKEWTCRLRISWKKRNNSSYCELPSNFKLLSKVNASPSRFYPLLSLFFPFPYFYSLSLC
jgi:hypothetical protein